MREPTTFIKLDRNILRWRWFQDSSTLHVFVYLILSANNEPADFRDFTVQRGEVCCSIAKICEDTGLTPRSVRTALERLIKTGEISKKRQNQKYTIYYIEGFSRYQAKPTNERQISDKQTTSERQTSDNPTTASKESKEEEEKKKYKKYKIGERAYAREAPTGIAAIDQILAAELAKQEGGGNNDQA